MRRAKRGYLLTNEDLAALLEGIANSIGEGKRSFDLDLQIITAKEALLERHHAAGLMSLNQLSLQLLPAPIGESSRYEYVRRAMEKLPPLDLDTSAQALRSLATEIRDRDAGGS